MPAGRAARDRDEIAVAAELVDIGSRPGDRGLDVGEVPGPTVMRGHPVVDGQAHPALLGQVRHQRIALQDPAAVDPAAARHEQEHRRGFGGQMLGPPHVEQLGRVIAVAHRRPVDVAAVLARVPQRREAVRGRPVDGQVSR